MKTRKTSASDLRNYYTLLLQTGLILALLIFIVAMKLDLASPEPESYSATEQEIIELDDIVRTEQIDVVPPPPVNPPPVAVPEDEIIEEADIDFSADIDFGQTLDLPPRPQEEEEEQAFFYAVEIPPQPVGGQEDLQRRMEYPGQARRAGIDGRVVLSFIVNEEGDVTDAEVFSSVHPLLDREALRVIQETKFTPGIQGGKPVKVRMSWPIDFILE